MSNLGSRRGIRPGYPVAVAACVWLAASVSLGAIVRLNPIKDNSIYEDNVDSSNGSGSYLFTGETNFVLGRRALLAFDIAGAIPSGSTITSVTLKMHVSKVAPFTPSQQVNLHPIQKNWGEGASNAGDPGGDGAPAEPGDATWLYTFFNTSTWSQLGGEFSPTSSGATTVSGVGFKTWASTPGMVADVQSWLGSPSGNYGWIVLANEHQTGTAIRFDSRENPVESYRPLLTVTYSTTPIAVGTVPDGFFVPGPELSVAKTLGGNLAMTWAPSCVGSDSDYEIYEGVLGNFTSHIPNLCSTSGSTSATITPGAGNRYYLVVASDGSAEGSYGKKSNGAERPPGAPSCRPQLLGNCP